jgi:hypothetical protein
MPRKPDLEQIDRIAEEVGGLTREQRRLLHEAIRHEGRHQLSLDEIRELAREIKELFPGK